MKKSYWITVTILGAAFVLFLIVGTTLFGGWGMMGGWPAGTMHGWGFSSFGWFGMFIMWLIPIGFVVLVVLGVVGLVRGFSSSGEGSSIINQQEESQTSPREIIQIRYAGAEITRQQYLQIQEDIK